MPQHVTSVGRKFAKNKNYPKNRSDCHYTGKYRGAAHSVCDLRFNVPNKIPVDQTAIIILS